MKASRTRGKPSRSSPADKTPARPRATRVRRRAVPGNIEEALATLGPAAGETLDPILGGLVRVLQRERGYRFSLDAILLADFATLPARARNALDLGAGAGVIALLLAATNAAERVVGLEVQAGLADLARRSVALSALVDRVEIVQGDLKDPDVLPRDTYDLVVSNPPFRSLAEGPPSPNRERAIARHELAANMAEVARAAKRFLRSSGRACFVYPAGRLAEACATLAQTGLWPRRLRLVHPRIEAAAELCLIDARKERGRPLEVLAPLVVHEGRGYTEELRRILRAG
jgi:tRNA1Val (adenine37-N6)-methyltransferase